MKRQVVKNFSSWFAFIFDKRFIEACDGLVLRIAKGFSKLIHPFVNFWDL